MNNRIDLMVTGFPGFLAGFLVRRLLTDNPQWFITALVETRFIPTADAAVTRIAADIPGAGDRIRLLAGDITVEYLGLPQQVYQELAERTQIVLHLAAVYDLAIDRTTAYRVNVEGTRKILDFCESVKNFKRLVYFSTCFVAGLRTGQILEDELDEGQSFKNFYEETKCRAETEVRERMSVIPTVVVRPAIVIGHSRTGETVKYDGPYYLIRLLCNLKRRKLLPPKMIVPMIGQGRVPINLIPVDYLVDISLAAIKFGEPGATYHAADPDPLSVRQFYHLVMNFFGLHVVGWIWPSVVSAIIGIPAVSRLLGMPVEILRYFNHHQQFDVANTTRLMTNTGISCPRLKDYYHTLIEYALNHPDL